MQRALRLIRRDPEITRCYWDKWDSTWYGELGATKAILNAGYNIDCLIHRYFNFNSHFVISFSQPRRTSPCVLHWWMVVSNLLQDFPSDWRAICICKTLPLYRILLPSHWLRPVQQFNKASCTKLTGNWSIYSWCTNMVTLHWHRGRLHFGQWALNISSHGFGCRFQGLDWRKKKNWECNQRMNPTGEKWMDGFTLSIYELMFVKLKDHLKFSTNSLALNAIKYSDWMDGLVSQHLLS